VGSVVIDSTKPIDGATPLLDTSGLKLSKSKSYTLQEIYTQEALNIANATLKYLSSEPTHKDAPFSYEWLLILHEEMLGEVWEWAGKLRQCELSIGIKAYLVSTELKKLVDDIEYWTSHKTYDAVEIATRIHHRAVHIHPFLNGNGRWSRMLANIYLRREGLMPVRWQEDLLAKENPKRTEYIESLKMADKGDYSKLIEMHQLMY